MVSTNFKEYVDAANNCVQAIGVIIGGAWVYWRFILKRERYPKIRFDLDLHVISRDHDYVVVEIIAVVENKGIVRHQLTNFKFNLLCLSVGAPIKEGRLVEKMIDETKQLIDVIYGQVCFEPCLSDRSFLPPQWNFTFVEAGVKQRYTYIARVPKTASTILVHSRFNYTKDESLFHTAQKALSVTSDKSE